MAERYPGYDVLAKRNTPSWNAKTREVIDARLAVSREPRFFSPGEWRTLWALCDRIVPQPRDRAPVPLPAYVDEKLYTGQLDGYRYAQLPVQGEAWRRGLAALEAEAQSACGAPFTQLDPAQQDALLGRMQRGELTNPAWQGMPCQLFFEHRVLPDITHAYYAHPTAWNEIGFGGPASPRGYARMGLDRRDPWEAPRALPTTHGTASAQGHRSDG
ncbi:MAG TPA: gluconate 2-dehydrogenase subunit 3 family protein [Steroidobacteraceae bacterium]|nr:gluconate 2-dehydrogenase subunit 3 family protein [Steroidobacteraceae bacterium]